MIVRVIPLNEHHECYRAEDIELWEVRKLNEKSQSIFNQMESNIQNPLIIKNWGNFKEINVKMNDIDFIIQQDVDGVIGSVLWPSSVIASRSYIIIYFLFVVI